MATKKKGTTSSRLQKRKSQSTGHTGAGTKAFRVAARTILHLGRELITSDEIAINELIKNAFDAGSPEVRVNIICVAPPAEVASLIEEVRDSGNRLDEIKAGVLTVLQEAVEEREVKRVALDHFNQKLADIQNARTGKAIIDALERLNHIEVTDTGKGMPRNSIVPVFLTVGTDHKVLNPSNDDGSERLGNKGIGRLAMMKLGDRATVTTWVEDDALATAVEFDWREFDSATRQISEIPIKTGRTAIPGVSKSGTIVTVFPLKHDWTAGGEKVKGLKTFIRRLRSPFSATRRFPIRAALNGTRPILTPPFDEATRELADQVLELSFDPEYVTSLSDTVLKMKLSAGADRKDAVPQERSAAVVLRMLEGTDGVRRRVKKRKQANPDEVTVEPPPLDLETFKRIGPFKLHILRFNRRQLREKAGQNWDTVKEELDLWSGGIAIYRDGFRVGFTGSDKDGDWLGLDAKALRGSGYVVNRIQVMGALEITHRGNPCLTDLTNREGLIVTPEVNALKDILLSIAIGPLRAQVEMEDQKAREQGLERLVNEGTATLADRLTLARQDVASLRGNTPDALKGAVTSLDSHLHFIAAQVKKFENAVQKASEGREEILELAGVGNVMHGVMHELTRTTAQTRELMRQLAGKADTETQALLEKLEQEIKAINVRLQQMDPLLPNARQTKRPIDVERLVRTILAGYENRFKRHGIEPIVVAQPSSAYIVNMVPGFLSLALENLIGNSVYWLGERTDKSTPATITVEVDPESSTVSVTDSGPGVHYADRERVFHPGFSLRSKGRGYGLYLAREVANYHGGNLYLDSAIGPSGGLNTFTLELPRKEQ